jgi:hypothetical protein
VTFVVLGVLDWILHVWLRNILEKIPDGIFLNIVRNKVEIRVKQPTLAGGGLRAAFAKGSDGETPASG